MIVLDTNVLSELMRQDADQNILRWIARLDSSEIYTTTINQAEILRGIAVLPEGRRRSAFQAAGKKIFANFHPGDILAFDSVAAEAFALIVANRRGNGRPIQTFDALIAAISMSRRAILATRNVRDFMDFGIEIVNPWDVVA